jgi:serine/threonine-protein kinase
MKAVLHFFLLMLTARLYAQSPCETSGPIPFEENGKWGYVSASGVAISPRFDLAGLFSSEGAVVCLADRCGLIDTSGSFIASQWNRSSGLFPGRYTEGLAPASKGDMWGYVDRSGQVVISYQFRYAGNFDHGMAKVLLGDKYFFIDKSGNRITPEFDGVFEFHEELAAVVVGSKVGYIRRDGTFAIRQSTGAPAGSISPRV